MTPRSAAGNFGNLGFGPRLPRASRPKRHDENPRDPRATLFVQALIAASPPDEINACLAFARRLSSRRLFSAN